jgi:hypothetical protein
VAQTYNPSYLGGRDQEDHSSKLAQENSSRDPISNPSQNRTGRVAQGVDLVLQENNNKMLVGE